MRWTTELLTWRVALVRWVLATADVASIAVTANAIIRVFMTILLVNIYGRHTVPPMIVQKMTILSGSKK